MNRVSKKRLAAGIALTGVSAVGTYLALRPRLLNWGATVSEITDPLPGDDRVKDATYVSTRAVTVHACPEHIWPWLAQMGYRRGGLYSYDWLDRAFGYLDGPSAETVLAEFQNLEAGDTIPLGRGPSWPVAEVVPGRVLVLEPLAGIVTWAFALLPVDRRITRLVTRVRFHAEDTAKDRLLKAAMDPAAFLMTRRMLLGIKRRAETLATVSLRASSSRPLLCARP